MSTLAVDAPEATPSTSGPTTRGEQRLHRRLAQAALAALGRHLGAHDDDQGADSKLATNERRRAQHDALHGAPAC